MQSNLRMLRKQHALQSVRQMLLSKSNDLPGLEFIDGDLRRTRVNDRFCPLNAVEEALKDEAFLVKQKMRYTEIMLHTD